MNTQSSGLPLANRLQPKTASEPDPEQVWQEPVDWLLLRLQSKAVGL